jgi:fused signal recognition particle receptor
MFGKLKNKLKEWTKKVSETNEIEKEIIEEITSENKKTKEGSSLPKEGEKIIKLRNSGGEEKSKKELRKEKREEKKKEKEEKKQKKKEEKEKEEEPSDEELKEVIEKGDYKELPEVSTPGSGKTEPNSEKLEEIKNKIPTDEELKKEVEKDKYIEPEKKFEIAQQSYQPDLEKTKEKKSFFKKITGKKTISENEFKEYSEDLEMILLENNVALEVSEKIIEELKEKIVGEELSKKEIEEKITKSLKEIIEKVLIEPFDIIKEIEEKKEPYTILFCGINGTGKTTHIAKFANMLKNKGITSVIAAGDTFRAAAVEQIKKHGENLDIKVISQDYGSDPAAVGFDARKYAEKNNIKVVLIDTAGRIHTATNLIREMEKIKRVVKPDRTIFVGESITGNDATDQVKAFNDNIGIDGIILSKADIDEKGGTALSVGYTTKKPILFLGTGQNYEDIEPFDKNKFIENLGL